MSGGRVLHSQFCGVEGDRRIRNYAHRFNTGIDVALNDGARSRGHFLRGSCCIGHEPKINSQLTPPLEANHSMER